MTALAADRIASPGHRVVLRDLARPADALAFVTPNWFAAVMGTGIVAIGAAVLPVHVPGLRAAATVVWLLAAALLVALTALTVAHWHRHPATARGHLTHPVFGHFYGAVPMALMTVGTSTLLVGKDVIGAPAAVAVDWTLWSLGTVLGLAGAMVVPYVMFVQGRAGTPFGGWLMSVVPPTVSASAGALLVPHTPAGAPRTALLVACYLLLVISVSASAVVIPAIVRQVLAHGPGAAGTVPTLFIVLGPLGQSITAANLLGAAAVGVVPDGMAATLHDVGIAYGIPVAALATVWLVVATRLVVRTARTGLPFGLTWWSFTFPVGTCVTGAAGLALHTGSPMFRWAAVVLYAALVVAWLVVAVRTFHGAVVRGYLFAPPA